MKQYIDKSALVAEINQRIEDYKSHKIDDSYHDGLIFALEDLRDDFINTLEVKEEPELTVDDIMKLDALLINMWQSKSPNKYVEVLKQFKAQKGEEV